MKDLITREELVKAIEGKLKLDEEDAVKGAEAVLNLFGFEDRVIDNILEPQDRQLFYALENAGFIRPGMEVVTLYDSREWRIHYWILERGSIKKASIFSDNNGEKKETNIYEKLPDRCFAR
ncbi:MAG: DUF6015 family protein [Candidatus Thermoplasmatota archaeon]|nr:DUF6015 family protein [Candidatus Thermoplasmatota archaeon]